jgi:hypothetical protein
MFYELARKDGFTTARNMLYAAMYVVVGLNDNRKMVEKVFANTTG